MYIQNEKLTIRNATPTDASILCKWWNDGKIMEHTGFPNGLNTTESNIREALKQDEDYGHRRLIIEYASVPIGEMSDRNMGMNTAQIGIKICSFNSQGKGLGSILLKMFIKDLFTTYDFDKIILDTSLKNERAQYVYEKLGFEKIKINFDSWVDQLGNLQSSVDYELNKDKWLID